MSHTVYIDALNSPVKKALDKINSDYPSFRNYMASIPAQEEIDLLIKIISDNSFLDVSFRNTPLLKVISYQADVVISTDINLARIFIEIIGRLDDLGEIRTYSYQRSYS